MTQSPYTVAIVGRTNVGKSTLFNRIVGQRISIVDDRRGVTRDVIARVFEWNRKRIRFLDTGGYEKTGQSEIEVGIRQHIEEAVELADALVLVVDITSGPTSEDEEAVELIRRSGHPVVVAANKADNVKREKEGLADFLHWGFDHLVAVSAVNGNGTGDLLDAVVETLPERTAEIEPDDEEDLIRVALVGRPNVGKSTLLNQMVGEERSLVTSIPGTTRDPVDTMVEREGTRFLLIDTAGIRRRGKVEGIEKYAVSRAQLAIERSDVVLLLVDAAEKVTETDAHVFGLAYESGQAAVLLVNKWDLIEKETDTAGAYAKEIRETCKFLAHCPIVFISAKTGQRTHRIWEEIRKVYGSYTLRIPTHELNQSLEAWVGRRSPPGIRGRHPNLHYLSQVGVKPPTFVLFASNTHALHFSYERYLTNQIRATYGFEGSPVRLVVREDRERDQRKRSFGASERSRGK